MKKFQPFNKFLSQSQGPARKLLRQRSEEKGEETERFFPEKIQRKNKKKEHGGEDHPDDPPEIKAGIGFGAGLEPRRIERPGQEEQAQKKAHRKHVEDPLDQHRPQSKTFPDFFFSSQIKWLNHLSHPAGQGKVHGKSDGVSGKHVPKLDLFFFLNKEISPS